MAEKGIDNEDTWRSIMLNHGSVMHLEELTKDEKAVFKTFKEISQLEIIQQASIRQNSSTKRKAWILIYLQAFL